MPKTPNRRRQAEHERDGAPADCDTLIAVLAGPGGPTRCGTTSQRVPNETGFRCRPTPRGTGILTQRPPWLSEALGRVDDPAVRNAKGEPAIASAGRASGGACD